MSGYTTLHTQLNQGILRITLNRPGKLNILSTLVLEELSKAFHAAQADPKVRALLITGEGKAFCAGADIKELQALDAGGAVALARKGQAVFRLLERLPKPSLAAVNGFAFGGGCELAMSASFRLASEVAKFSQPEVKLAVIPGFGGTQRLARLIGKGRALDLCLTGRMIDATKACDWGLVSDVVAPENLLSQSETLLGDLTEMSQTALAYILSSIHTGYDLPIDEAMEVEALNFGMSFASPDKDEGVSAFIEKRKADYHQ